VQSAFGKPEVPVDVKRPVPVDGHLQLIGISLVRPVWRATTQPNMRTVPFEDCQADSTWESSVRLRP